MEEEKFKIHENVIETLKKAGYKQIEVWEYSMFCHYDNKLEAEDLPSKNKNNYYELTKRTNYKL